MGKQWIKERRADPFYRGAKAQGYRSRAAFKLLQIQERFALLAPGDLVLDLGAAPGSWSQVASELVGTGGHVVALDQVAMVGLEGVNVVRGDAREKGTLQAILKALGRPADAVLSDMSPRLSGNRSTDHARSVDLAMVVLGICGKALRPGGRAAVKVFQGDLFPSALDAYRARFADVHGFGPRASRSGSAETYVVARGFRG